MMFDAHPRGGWLSGQQVCLLEALEEERDQMFCLLYFCHRGSSMVLFEAFLGVSFEVVVKLRLTGRYPSLEELST
jgi:hypothetical protein